MSDDPYWDDHTVEAIARNFHDEYERYAPLHDYETRPDSAVDWEDVDPRLRGLMCATVNKLLLLDIIEPGGRAT